MEFQNRFVIPRVKILCTIHYIVTYKYFINYWGFSTCSYVQET